MAQISYFDIAWFSSVDGPGTRVVLYLSWCHLRCPWCHSPHSWGLTSQLLFFESKCVLCGNCVLACTNKTHEIVEGKHLINRDSCTKCGSCIKACPESNSKDWKTNCLGFAGSRIDINELYDLLKPQLGLLKNVGGLTVSGGDPVLQHGPLSDLLRMCTQDGIHTTVETSANYSSSNFQNLLPYVNHWLIGLRPSRIDNENSWETTKNNVHNLSVGNSANITIRTPIIPGYTDSVECFQKIKDVMINANLNAIELLPYNPYSENYYRALGIEYLLKDAELSPGKIEMATKYFTNYGITVKVVN